jgi:uncharacterized membrane protein
MVDAMLAILLGLLGFVLGVAGEETAGLVGALSGAALGVALQALKKARTALDSLVEARAQITRLTLELNSRNRAPDVASPVTAEQPAPSTPTVVRSPVAPLQSASLDVPLHVQRVEAERATPSAVSQAVTPAIVTQQAEPTYRADVESASHAHAPGVQPSTFAQPAVSQLSPVTLAYQWLFGGNTVVRVGLLVLLVGVVLLLKWAADNELFPIELRLMFAALLGITMLVVGYRQRTARPGFGLSLQGGGIAGLYLTTFFAYRLYELIPSGFAFAVLAALALFTSALSLLQQAQGLALIGLLGGYLAPILASSGAGSHIGLFAYVALLNIVVLVLVALKGWVNVARLGFLFTFGFLVGWRVLRYEPDHLLTTEPFVVIFFLTYLAVPLLLARFAEAEKVRGLGILFGTPLATLGVQAALLHEQPLYMALATVCLGLVYVGVARPALKRDGALRQVGIAFVAIAVGMATVAIPYALQAEGATGAAWAIEGVGIVWFGLRQKHKWTVVAGVVMQLLGLLLYSWSLEAMGDDGWVPAPVRIWLGAWLQAAALYVTGYLGHRDAKGTTLGKALQAGLFMASVVFLFGPWPVLLEYTQDSDGVAAVGVWMPVGAVVLDRLALMLRYPLGRFPVLVVLPFVPLFLLASSIEATHVFAGWQGLAWLVVAAAVYYVLRTLVNAHLPRLAWLYGVCAWWVCLVLSVEWAQLSSNVWQLGNGWTHGALLLAPVLVVLYCAHGTRSTRVATRLRWLGLRHSEEQPERSVPNALLSWGATPVVMGMVLLLLGQNALVSGDMDPLPYVVIFNPLDLLQLSAFVAIWTWTRRVRAERPNVTLAEIATGYAYALFALIFVWFNAMLARAVHHYAHVEFTPWALFHSDVFQVTVSVAWALLALSLMWWTSRTKRRSVWFVGVTLLGATIVKLFLVDLSRLGAGAKILTFLAVGLLVLLIGYLSPLPPSNESEKDKKPKPRPGEV